MGRTRPGGSGRSARSPLWCLPAAKAELRIRSGLARPNCARQVSVVSRRGSGNLASARPHSGPSVERQPHIRSIEPGRFFDLESGSYCTPVPRDTVKRFSSGHSGRQQHGFPLNQMVQEHHDCDGQFRRTELVGARRIAATIEWRGWYQISHVTLPYPCRVL
jgi:hypothetical protein